MRTIHLLGFLASLTAVICVWSAVAVAQPVRFVIDGVFDEWTDDYLLHEDPSGDAVEGQIDLGRFWAHAQGDYLFISFETGVEVNLQRFNDLTLYIDTDRDAETGLAVNGIGAEVVWRFGQLQGTFYGGSAPRTYRQAELGIISGPTVSGTRFEVAIRLDAEVGGTPLFPQESVYMVLRDGASGDALPDEGGVLVSLAPSEAPAFQIDLDRRDGGHLRLLSYNVERDGLLDPSRESAYRRILQAIQPDVIAFQEIYQSTPQDVAQRMEEMLPSGPGEQWYVSQAYRSDIYLASRFPIDQTDAICRDWVIATTCNGAFYLDLSRRYTENLYVINAHPPCCNSDFTRQQEIDQFMGHLRDVQELGWLPANTPIVVTGDLNLVGHAQQLHTILSGDIVNTELYGPPFAPDWDGSDLLDARPLTTAMPAAFTWFDPGSAFHPGRLDFVIYSGSVLDIANSYALFTPALPQHLLTQYGLHGGDTSDASDHLPVVADLALTLRETSTPAVPEPSNSQVGAVHPNPASGIARLPVSLARASTVEIDVYDLLGRRMWSTTGDHAVGDHTIVLDLSGLAPGTYLLRVRIESVGTTQRIVVHR